MFGEAFRTYESLSEARDAVGGERDRTVVLMDGAVACMAVPGSVKAFEEYARVVWSSVHHAMRSGKVVVVTFDEPEVMTNAKRLEQARRDSVARKRTKVACSDDLAEVVAPPDPNFDRAELFRMLDVHALTEHRPCKARFFDEIALHLLREATAEVGKWLGSDGAPIGALLLDGVDPRGAMLPRDAQRAPEMLGTDAALVALFSRPKAIGEGDVKLSQLEHRVRQLVAAGQASSSPSTETSGEATVAEAHDSSEPAPATALTQARMQEVSLVQHCTIDTDALAIGVIDVAKRRKAPQSGSVHALLCMRERSAKRSAQHALGAAASGGTFTTVDLALLESHVQKHMWGVAPSPSLTASQLLQSALAFVAGAVLCGCDFVQLKGSNFPHVLEALPSFVRNEPRALQLLESALKEDEDVALGSTQAVKTLCCSVGECMVNTPRYGRQALLVREAEEDVLRKTVWTLAYWSGLERTADERWGFLTLSG